MNYVGTELELFQHATHWKRYWSSTVRAQIKGDVLDVGCGLGVNAPFVMNDRVRSYTFLEPDADLLGRVALQQLLPTHVPGTKIQGTTKDLPGRQFDSLLYIDVLEHIEDPGKELGRARDLLAPGGHVIIVVPAFQFLYSPFDKAIGHFRRYTKGLLRSQTPTGLRVVSMNYLDSAGLLLSLGNKLFIRHAAPTREQITFWDKRVVPVSRFTDALVGHTFGRSLVAVLQRS